MNLVLLGMMGSGKTTVGLCLSKKTSRPLLDTDAEIVKTHGEIKRIFAEHGERYFRELERGLAERLSKTDGQIIATGGGFVLEPKNAENLRKNGTLVYLRATAQTLEKRLKKDGERPLLEGEESLSEKIARLLIERGARYESLADVVVDVDGKSVEEVAEEILKKVGRKQ